jgi:hypothetical protein
MEANDASLVSGDATTRAQELRANLGARQVAETLLAEAGRVRQDAALAADAMVEEAQQLSEQLLAESRRMAEQTAAEARESAEAVLAEARLEAEEISKRARAEADALRARAETEIEEHRRRVRAEVTAQVTAELTEQQRAAEATAREQSEALVSDLEASVRILGVSLESARSNVGELLASLEAMRPTAAPAARRADPTVAELGSVSAGSRPAGEPLDSLFYGDAPAGTTGVPSAPSPFGTDTEEPEPGRPRSATEAFLSSSSLEIEQSHRELHDLQHPEEARRRRVEDSEHDAQRRELDAGAPDEEDAPPAEESRPLGWLFRTAQ